MSSYQLDTQAGASSIVLMLDSENADKYYMTAPNGRRVTSFFSKTLATPIIPPRRSQMLVSLHSCTIPYSFYNLRDGINTHVDFVLAGEAGHVLIPEGNYSTTSLGTALATLLAGHATTKGLAGFSARFSFSSRTYKYTLTIGGAHSFVLDFDGAHQATSASAELGFNRGESHTVAPSVEAPNVVDISGSTHGIYIRTNLSSSTVIDSKGVASNILSRVPIMVPNGGLIFYNPSEGTHHKHLVGNRIISEVVCQLTDTRGRLLDLNGLHWQLQISFDFVVDKPQLLYPRGGHVDMRQRRLQPDLLRPGYTPEREATSLSDRRRQRNKTSRKSKQK